MQRRGKVAGNGKESTAAGIEVRIRWSYVLCWGKKVTGVLMVAAGYDEKAKNIERERERDQEV